MFGMNRGRTTEREDGTRKPEGAERPQELQGVPKGRIVDVDVRDDLRRGEEPFSRIMQARRGTPVGGILRVRAIFEPVPLYGVMEGHGLDHWTEELAPDDWRVWFFDPEAVTGSAPDSGAEP